MKLVNHIKHNLKRFLYERKNTESILHKKSYSQCGEDLIIKFIFDSLSISLPTYIDIGAHHPFRISNTALFYELGSKGINIDPDKSLIKKFYSQRPKDINLNIGIGPEKSNMELFIMSNKTLNTLSKKEANKYVKEGFEIITTENIEVLTIDEVLKTYNNDIFPDLLTLDAEGFDLEILKTIKFKKSFPKVICVETISFSVERKGIKNCEIIDFLTSNGYFLYADTYINSIFIKEEIWI